MGRNERREAIQKRNTGDENGIRDDLRGTGDVRVTSLFSISSSCLSLFLVTSTFLSRCRSMERGPCKGKAANAFKCMLTEEIPIDRGLLLYTSVHYISSKRILG